MLKNKNKNEDQRSRIKDYTGKRKKALNCLWSSEDPSLSILRPIDSWGLIKNREILKNLSFMHLFLSPVYPHLILLFVSTGCL